MQSFQGFLKRFGHNVKKIRNQMGLTQIEASEKSDIPARRYQAVEAGTANLTLRSLFRLAQAFRKKPRELL